MKEVQIPLGDNLQAAATADKAFMLRALELAKRGEGAVNPNPLVGCVLVRNGRIIGEGWHTAFGKPHAEREALADCARRGESARGATAYVTLEPCSHFGKTPPCADALVEAGVARVVVGTLDPNPLVAGRGCACLREAGIRVDCGVLEDACRSINRVFFHFIQYKRPYVVAKYAMTLDGKIATRTGASKWITGAEARQRVHEDRARYAAIMVGVNTVIADDPLLTCRLEASCTFCGTPRNPVRVICDSRLRTPLDARVVESAREVSTLIATCVEDERAHAAYRNRGCEVAVVPSDAQGRVSLEALLDVLGARGIDGVIVEGGSTLLGAAFDAGIVNAVRAYVAPKVFGGAQAPSPVGGLGVSVPADALALGEPRVTQLGRDLLVECEVI